MSAAETWLIWSMEHRAWWAPERNGYTRYRAKAGRYSFDEAKEIVQGGNMGAAPDFPHEAMIASQPQEKQS